MWTSLVAHLSRHPMHTNSSHVAHILPSVTFNILTSALFWPVDFRIALVEIAIWFVIRIGDLIVEFSLYSEHDEYILSIFGMGCNSSV